MVRPTPPDFRPNDFADDLSHGFGPGDAANVVDYRADAPCPPPTLGLAGDADRWVSEQMFEEDVRAVLKMMRPNGRERLQGWNEYRTGGSHYRITVSWDDEFQITAGDTQTSAVPHLADVIETLLVGSAKGSDDASAAEEFDGYREVVRDVYQRLQQRQACYE